MNKLGYADDCCIFSCHFAVHADVPLEMLFLYYLLLLHLSLCFLVVMVQTLHVVIVCSSYNSQERLTSLQHTKIGLDFALNEYNSLRNSTASNVTYEVVYLDNPKAQGCPDNEAKINDVVRFYYSRQWDTKNVMTLITPGCGDSLVLGSLAREWKVFMMTTGSMYSETKNRQEYPSFISISPIQADVTAEALLDFLGEYKWTSMTVIHDATGVAGNNDLISALREQANKQIPPLRLTHLSATSAEPYDLLAIARSVSRIIYLSMRPMLVRKFMLNAEAMNMTNGDYVYFVPQLARSFINGNLTWQNKDQFDEAAFRAYRSLLQQTPCSPSAGNQRSESFLDQMANISKSRYDIPFLPGDDLPSDVTTAAYYGFWMLNEVINELLHNRSYEQVPLTGTVIAERFLGRRFHEGNELIYIDHIGQRRSSQCFRNLNIKTRSFEETVTYDTTLRRLVAVANRSIDWASSDGRAPHNTPLCGYHNENPACQIPSVLLQNTIVTAVTTSCLTAALAILTLAGFILRRKPHMHAYALEDFLLSTADIDVSHPLLHTTLLPWVCQMDCERGTTAALRRKKSDFSGDKYSRISWLPVTIG